MSWLDWFFRKKTPHVLSEIRYGTGETVQVGDYVNDNGFDAIVEKVVLTAEDIAFLGANAPGLVLKWDVGLPMWRPVTSEAWEGIMFLRRHELDTRMVEVRIRCINPGEHIEIFKPLLTSMRGTSIAVSKIYCVPESDIYKEGILPPVLTVFCDKNVFAVDSRSLTALSTAVEEVVRNYKALNLNGYAPVGGELQQASDVGVFVDFGNTIVKYYVKPNEYTSAVLPTIASTLGSVVLLEFVEKSQSTLGTVVMWNQRGWQLFASETGDLSR